jgi:AraC-like DNA-binding protein
MYEQLREDTLFTIFYSVVAGMDMIASCYTYNAYINGLRIQHFINLYREAVATHKPVTAQQLAHQSGFRNYNTFGVAFKPVMGMTATEWKQNVAE